ncbi:MAG: LysR family transcriptional regulator [Paraburkholderia sp.]|uniref:LysR family transcriptional regulator n=1 Tax=Paraburkholderia sp. TaxID=1926495 RepID=UPI0011F76EEA|nr:LysR family transcriptional regulator [Paraburkholderia sp.]TAM06495.1 MAG: LysR family transcriptional regulator [Paraburkholderia sp.]TAM29083.1 MAG: LysR family transcriptional regulator [Paraburkholderia sp.]
MKNLDLNVLQAFFVVARERSFTRAAAQLGVSQSALSHSMRGLEEKIGLRLLTRTTRGVSPTEAGERLLSNVGPYYEAIEAELESLSALREKPAGLIRISAHDHASDTVLWPKLKDVLRSYPDVSVEININYGMVDIVAERFDAGVRNGDLIAQDMIAVRIGPDFKMAVVGSPEYLRSNGRPVLPHDLAAHNCINLRLPTRGGLYAWEFARKREALHVNVHGQFIFNTTPQMLDAALEGYGLAYVPHDLATPHLAEGRLSSVLDEWCPTVPGYHLYYASRRQTSPAFALIIDALRYVSPAS